MTQPRLDQMGSVHAPRGVVLMLHGGQQRSLEKVEDRHASWWRMARMAKSLRSFARSQELDLHLLQYHQRGWNDDHDPAPVRDARWALDQLPEVPIVLVGHSMGGRTACRIADDPRVQGVVALAPWLPQGEPNSAVQGRDLRVLHGTHDRWTSARLSKDYVERSRRIARSAEWTSMPGAGHFMLRRVRAWNRFVEDSITDIMSTASSREEASSEDSM